MRTSGPATGLQVPFYFVCTMVRCEVTLAGPDVQKPVERQRKVPSPSADSRRPTFRSNALGKLDVKSAPASGEMVFVRPGQEMETT